MPNDRFMKRPPFLWFRMFLARSFLVAGSVFSVSTIAVVGQSAAAQRPGSIPLERPPIRPPSALHGWADWDRAREIFSRVQVPPASVLTAEQQLASFRVAPGFRVELVASEPMVANPIFFEFDEDGRLWALEYRGYMRDLDGRGEADRICRLVVLEDTDADGRADVSHVYLDGLVMPRSFAFVEGGVLLAEPPTLWFCQDTDNDLRCDTRTKVGTYGVAGNPQHTANGLRRGLDNWLHSADWNERHRFRDGQLIVEEVLARGQFGVSFDDLGRFYTCRENLAAIADYIPEEYLRRNANLVSLYHRSQNRERFGVQVRISRKAQEVFPIRPTPQITLGGLELRDDGTLRTYTVVAGTCVYRGHQFPDDAYGNLFVPEAGGHLVGRLALEGDVGPSARRYYPDGQELLASTDERFRPVNARTGPDGALYIADMYKGIIEHVIFMVPWLADQIRERGLESGNDRGRIWRIVATDRPIDRRSPALSNAPVTELVTTLNHPNGWHRDTAQRLLVDRRPAGAVPLLRRLVTDGAAPRGRVHALWTLEGMDALDETTVRAAVRDMHPGVRATGLRVMERLSTSSNPDAIVQAVGDLLDRDNALVPVVAQQAILTLGTAMAASGALERMQQLLEIRSDWLARAAVLTGVGNREIEFLRSRLDRRSGGQPWRQDDLALFHDLACLVALDGRPDRIESLLRTAHTPGLALDVTRSLLDGFLAMDGGPVTLARRPEILDILDASDAVGDNERAMKLRRRATWPGNTPWAEARVDLAPLTEEHAELVRQGADTYTRFCGGCHQPHGGGLEGVAPPLIRSEWVSGPPEHLARIVLHGLVGPIQVRGEEWNLYMPGFGSSGAVSDSQIAGVLTFIRRAWGNRAGPVEPDLIAHERVSTAGRTFPWTASELMGDEDSDAGIALSEPDADGQIRLRARDARLVAHQLRYHPNLDLLGPWVLEGDAALWNVTVPATGTYRVFLVYAMDDKNAGNKFVIESDVSMLRGTVASTGGFDQFVERRIGTLKLRQGINRILVRPDGAPEGELIDLRTIRLEPDSGQTGFEQGRLSAPGD